MGHPGALWMLSMTEFWERFAFYGIRWALVLYIVDRFHGGAASGQAGATLVFGSYIALVFAASLIGGVVADKIVGYQHAIVIGAAFMASGLFMLAYPHPTMFKLGLATVIVGNGLFKPNISTMVGKLYCPSDIRRDAGFTIFYMGINAGAFVAPILTQFLAQKIFGTAAAPAYRSVFAAAGCGMLVSLAWFLAGRGMLAGVGAAPPGPRALARPLATGAGAAALVPLVFVLLAAGARNLQVVLTVLFAALAAALLVEGARAGKVARDKVLAMLTIFAFNIVFWMFFDQAGSSFTFLADKIVDRQAGRFLIPTAWFQAINGIAVIALAPPVAFAWVWLARRRAEPTVARKFALGLLANGAAFGLLALTLTHLVDGGGKIPAWTLCAVYAVQSLGELCLSPIGLSMVTRLAPPRLAGLGMGGWFLSTGIGANLSGIFASHVSGARGIAVDAALRAYSLGSAALLGAALAMLLLAPKIQKWMHGIR